MAVVALRCIAWIGVASVSAVLPSHAAYDPIHDDGFDCRLWYVDADADGFGAAGTGVLTCAPGPGRAPRADDCDDGTSSIHPLAVDRPDVQFIDANCDGFDGDATRAIHVALTGIDTPTCGARTEACRTVGFAFAQRSVSRPDLYVQQGTYAGPVQLSPGVQLALGLYGGFGSDWVRTLQATTTIVGGPDSGVFGATLGLRLSGGTVELGDLTIQAPDVPDVPNPDGDGAYAVISQQSVVNAFRVRLLAGHAASGRAGTGGGNPPAPAASGSVGTTGATVIGCSDLPGGAGGAGAPAGTCFVSGATGGGAGGRGGASDASCGPSPPEDSTALGGQRGADAALATPTSGIGGAGGAGGVTCSGTANGLSGAAGFRGNGGFGEVGATAASVVLLGNSGSDGQLGFNGRGGGGGGGAGGCDAGMFFNGRGPGGGGGGAGGCAASVPGRGGQGGGASVGWLVREGTVTFRNGIVQTGTGGRGGNGGAGVPGQPGGPGGAGGPAAVGMGSTESGGSGGDGGEGGWSGGGGGGAGGLSAGFVVVGGALIQSDNQFIIGVGGAGGAGGVSRGGSSDGTAGLPGQSTPVKTCVNTNC
jgi:hypothetical protein